MASRKNLKKQISSITFGLLSECLIRKQYIPGTDCKAIDAIISEILDTDIDFTSRISHTEPGSARKYYKAFYSDFNSRIDSILKKLEETGKK